MIPYPTWLGSGDNAWQMTAATLVGLMSIPALAVLYGGLVQKKWAMNTVLMVFSTFCLVLITWVLWAYKMGFGTPLISTFVGDPRTILGASALQGQANIPLLNGLMPSFKLPAASVEYFQFVFAAITPILFIGSVLGRISFKVWLVFVPLWITFAYSVNAFLLWGGGYWAGKGALDFSGGYVIHLAAGVSGFTAAAIIGPRLKRDREKAIPNNLMFVALGAGILWLGWNGSKTERSTQLLLFCFFPFFSLACQSILFDRQLRNTHLDPFEKFPAHFLGGLSGPPAENQEPRPQNQRTMNREPMNL